MGLFIKPYTYHYEDSTGPLGHSIERKVEAIESSIEELIANPCLVSKKRLSCLGGIRIVGGMESLECYFWLERPRI